jgi:DNA-binding MarR family transcriptional regulator
MATTANELARKMDVDAGAVTRMLDRLEAKGLLERVRSESDRRVVHLQLTAAGQATAAEVPHVLAAVNNDLLRGFSEAEWKQLRKFIDRLTANAAELQAQRGIAP